MTMRLDISIGPVQGFVAQSRRTRDLWGSSYLLSFLCAHAMHGAERAGGRFVQPVAKVVEKDPLFLWVCGQRKGEPPQIGSVSNHFALEVNGDVQNVAEASKQALDGAWMEVCSVVWEHFVKHACSHGNATDDIWNRQIGGFWEVMWTAGNSSTGGGLLGCRKHWRNHRPPEEPGDKCTVMHDLQELSGHVRGESPTSRDLQDRFWETVGDRLGRLDLRDNERLCAVALVKRLFPKVARQALGWPVDASHWRSTVYVGALPWIRRVVQTKPGLAREYAEAVRRSTTDVPAEQMPPFAGLEDTNAGDFAKLDANYMRREFVAKERLCPLNDDAADGTREDLGKLLQAIYDARDETGRTLGPPPAFYALILADGDRLGKLLGQLGHVGGETVSLALAAFTTKVSQIVSNSGGDTIYAGGDDVLAMLPVPGALDCADKLAEAYRAAFEDAGTPAQATLSAAVLFAHVRLPLNHVVRQAHRLLDNVAKDGNGRNSLVAAVLKPGGMQCQWVTTWARHGPEGEVRAVGLLGNLIEQLKSSATEPGLSSSLIYRMRDTLTRLCGWDRWRPGNWGSLPQGLDVRAFLRAEIHHSLGSRMDSGADARADVMTASVWNLLGPARNPQGDKLDTLPGDNENNPATEAGVDSLLLARFLADPEEQESNR